MRYHILPLGFSDHQGIFLSFRYFNKIKLLFPSRLVWCYKNADFDLAFELLDQVEWNVLLPDDDVNAYWDIWHKKFMEVMDKGIPKKRLSRRSRLPWINK